MEKIIKIAIIDDSAIARRVLAGQFSLNPV
jgi:hypothetical protein